MKAGETCQIRACGGRGWIDARVKLASANGKSLALTCDQTLGTGEGFFVAGPASVVLLLREGEEWRDLASGQICELRESGE